MTSDGPLLQLGGVQLCQDSTCSVWTKWLSDPSAVATVKQVCKAWHNHAVQAYAGTIKLEAFGSVQALAKFRSAKNLDCRDVQWLTNDDLRRIPEVMLSLRGIDISGCQNVSSVSVKAFVKSMGSRLLAFAQDTTPEWKACKHMRVTDATITCFADQYAPGLEELSLTLGSAVKKIEGLSGHRSLRSLAIFFEGFTPLQLPASLPALRELTIKTSSWSGFPWPGPEAHTHPWFAHLSYPMLELLTIDDHTEHGTMSRQLTREFVIGWSTLFPNATVRVIHAGPFSDILAPLHSSFVVQNGQIIVDDH
jgi:hypothetical protein